MTTVIIFGGRRYLLKSFPSIVPFHGVIEGEILSNGHVRVA
jgi:hypothetical protein